MNIEEGAIAKAAVLQRFNGIMRRHIERDDIHLTDDEFVRVVMRRYEKARERPLIDPNE